MCDVELITVSKLCSEIMKSSCKSFNRDNYMRPYTDLKDALYDDKISDEDDLINIFWKYSRDEYFKINDYISYAAAMILSGEKRFYLLLHDFEDPWLDNGKFLKTLDMAEFRRELEKHRDIYDVKIKRAGDPDSDEEEERALVEADNFVPVVERTDFEVLDFAMRVTDAKPFLTMDCFAEWKMKEDIKQGIPRDKKKLVIPPEEVIERAKPKTKVKDDKKGEKSDKKKDDKKKKGDKKKK